MQTGKDEATVIGKFYVNNKRILKAIKSVSNNPDIEEDILVQRSIDKNGRSRCRLNDVPITVSLLKDVGDLLVNIHGQHEHEALLQGINQIYILDDFGGTTSLREEFARLFQQTTEKTRLRDDLKNSLQERRQKSTCTPFKLTRLIRRNSNRAKRKNWNAREACSTTPKKSTATLHPAMSSFMSLRTPLLKS